MENQKEEPDYTALLKPVGTTQETLEEVAERYYEENIDQSNIPREHYDWEIKELMIGFANELQQQNDENLRRAFQAGEKYNNFKTFCPNFEEWLTKFKKK